VWLDDPDSGGGAVFAFTLPAEPVEQSKAVPAPTAVGDVP
jgi:hypothetical protein